MVGEKIRDTRMSETLREECNQMLLLPQGPLGIRPPPSHELTFLDKGLVTPLP